MGKMKDTAIDKMNERNPVYMKEFMLLIEEVAPAAIENAEIWTDPNCNTQRVVVLNYRELMLRNKVGKITLYRFEEYLRKQPGVDRVLWTNI